LSGKKVPRFTRKKAGRSEQGILCWFEQSNMSTTRKHAEDDKDKVDQDELVIHYKEEKKLRIALLW